MSSNNNMFSSTPNINISSDSSYVSKPNSIYSNVNQENNLNPPIINNQIYSDPLLGQNNVSQPAQTPQIYAPNTMINTQIPPQQIIVPPQYQVQNNSITSPLLNNDRTPFDIVELFQDLADAGIARIEKFFDDRELCQCTNLLPQYNISITSRKDMQTRNIFVCKCMTEGCCGPQNMNIRMKYIPRDTSQNYITINNYDIRLLDIKGGAVKPCCFQKDICQVTYNFNNQLLGEIIEPKYCVCCCEDPLFRVNSNRHMTRYNVTTDGSQCSVCCCAGCCCSLNEISFPIYDSLGNQIVGEILKERTSVSQKNNQYYRINFPADSFPEDKILLIANAMIIDYEKFLILGKRGNY